MAADGYKEWAFKWMKDHPNQVPSTMDAWHAATELAVKNFTANNSAMVQCRSHMYPAPCSIDKLMMCRETPCRIERPTQHQ